jgi:hypothetical protein
MELARAKELDYALGDPQYFAVDKSITNLEIELSRATEIRLFVFKVER